MLTEVKNVNGVSLTKQIRDFAKFAEKEGLQFILVVKNKGTKLSKPLQELVETGKIKLEFLND